MKIEPCLINDRTTQFSTNRIDIMEINHFYLSCFFGKNLVGIFSGLFTIQASNTKLNNIFEIQSFIEQNLERENIDINSHIYFTSYKKILEEYCPSNVMQTTKKELPILKKTWKASLDSSPHQKLTERFNLLKNLIQQVKSTEIEVFCKQKYLLYNLREETQILHKTLVIKTETKTETEHFSATEPKHHLKILYTQNHTPNNSKLISKINNHLQKQFGELISDRILDTQDLKTLEKKIEININPSCFSSKGSFHLLQDSSTKEKRFKGIKLNISTCKEEQLTKHIEQLLIHEL